MLVASEDTYLKSSLISTYIYKPACALGTNMSTYSHINTHVLSLSLLQTHTKTHTHRHAQTRTHAQTI